MGPLTKAEKIQVVRRWMIQWRTNNLENAASGFTNFTAEALRDYQSARDEWEEVATWLEDLIAKA